MKSEKKTQIAKVLDYSQTDAGRAFRLLIGVWINELRKKNDTAEGNEFIKNQGAIREFKLMHKAIGPKLTTADYDGGFGA
ncbi:MAG: hypothetical protein ACYTE8_00470 [Planctomycetota bacterium]|jgi:hypothetical protein